ncbi:MAG: HlyC/CorC family transporter [Rhizobiaceae bacterium]|jgi:CBS domain containing-hemolysin-like protein|nr:HlyC/CorC family transporter [Rhizobiaceae bacterium]
MVSEKEENPTASSQIEAASADKPVAPEKSLVLLPEGKTTGFGGSSLFSWLYGIFSRRKDMSSIREDLADALSDHAGTSESFSADERVMLTSILRLRDVRVEDLMVPRADIIAVNEEITLAELLKQFEESGHSRMPVYGETLDDPKGMIHIRDVVAYITKTASQNRAEIARRKNKLPANLDLRKVNLSKPVSSLKILREVVYVPPSMGARELLTRMQADRRQIALVIDEYGGTDGLVSLEDIVEEIVGDIEDEHDDEEDLILAKENGSYVCDAKAELEDISELLGEDFAFGEHEEDVDTIGGLLFDILGRVPVRGEVINKNGFEFRILEADPRRIKRIELLRSARRRTRKPAEGERPKLSAQ